MQILQDNNLGNHLTLKAIGRSMTIDYLPNSGKFDNIMITLVDCNGNEEAKQVFPATSQPGVFLMSKHQENIHYTYLQVPPQIVCTIHCMVV